MLLPPREATQTHPTSTRSGPTRPVILHQNFQSSVEVVEVVEVVVEAIMEEVETLGAVVEATVEEVAEEATVEVVETTMEEMEILEEVVEETLVVVAVCMMIDIPLEAVVDCHLEMLDTPPMVEGLVVSLVVIMEVTLDHPLSIQVEEDFLVALEEPINPQVDHQQSVGVQGVKEGGTVAHIVGVLGAFLQVGGQGATAGGL